MKSVFKRVFKGGVATGTFAVEKAINKRMTKIDSQAAETWEKIIDPDTDA